MTNHLPFPEPNTMKPLRSRSSPTGPRSRQSPPMEAYRPSSSSSWPGRFLSALGVSRRPPISALKTDVDDAVRRRGRTTVRVDHPPTPYVRATGELVWPHTSFMSGNMHIQEYDLRADKSRPRRWNKPYHTIKTEREVHELLGYEDPPPLYGRYETIRTLDRLDEVLEEEQERNDFERLLSWLKNKWQARKERKAAKRKSRLASDATELEMLPQHHNSRA